MARTALSIVSEVETVESWREQPQLFTRGAIMAKRLSNKTLSEIKKIKASNDAYYKALSARDMHAMERVWTCAADNMLIAPPANPRVYAGGRQLNRTGKRTGPDSPNTG